MKSWSEVKWKSVVSNSLRPHGLYSPWNSPGQNTRVDSISLLQRIFQSRDRTQVSGIVGRFFTSWATILRGHKNCSSLYSICLGWWWSQPGTFVNICHFWLPQFGDWIWYLVGRVHGYFYNILQYTWQSPHPPTMNYLTQNVTKTVLEKLQTTLYM